MELFTILLSGLLAALSPVNLVADKVVENNLRSRLNKVEQLQVRIDNAPSYQLVQGKVERVRIAGRGLWLTPNVRIGALELETDPLNLDLQRLRRGGRSSARASLRQPVQAGLRLVFTKPDINKTLQTPAVVERIRVAVSRAFGGPPERYQIRNPQVDFLSNKRIRFQVELLEKDAEPLAIAVESGLSIATGYSLQLIEPTVSLNGKPLSGALAETLTRTISSRLDLRKLEEAGITARLLALNVNTSELELAGFVRVDPTKRMSMLGSGVSCP